MISALPTYDSHGYPVGLDTHFQIGEIIGYRIWLVEYPFMWGRKRLRSFYTRNLWPRTGLMDGRPEEYPQGVYAFKTESNLFEFLAENSLHHLCSQVIHGRVQLWGKVIEHELGYRGEHARIVSLDGGGNKRLLKKLRKYYQLETRWYVRAARALRGLRWARK